MTRFVSISTKNDIFICVTYVNISFIFVKVGFNISRLIDLMSMLLCSSVMVATINFNVGY